MIKKKICILGEFGVGKTSIVNRFVNDVFDERYLTTIGVSIKQRTLQVGANDIDLIIWDIAGEQDETGLVPIYLRGMSGYVLVCDVTRKDFVESTKKMIQSIRALCGDSPHVVLLNKTDKRPLEDFQAEISVLEHEGEKVFLSSAKTGRSVLGAFENLVKMMNHHERAYEEHRQFPL